MADEDAILNRRCVWIQAPGFGDIFARCLGDPADPLVLYVHGSGPRNSSATWSHVATQLQRTCGVEVRSIIDAKEGEEEDGEE